MKPEKKLHSVYFDGETAYPVNLVVLDSKTNEDWLFTFGGDYGTYKVTAEVQWKSIECPCCLPDKYSWVNYRAEFEIENKNIIDILVSTSVDDRSTLYCLLEDGTSVWLMRALYPIRVSMTRTTWSNELELSSVPEAIEKSEVGPTDEELRTLWHVIENTLVQATSSYDAFKDRYAEKLAAGKAMIKYIETECAPHIKDPGKKQQLADLLKKCHEIEARKAKHK